MLGKAKTEPHFAKDECRPSGAHVVQLHYAFLGKRATDKAPVTEEDSDGNDESAKEQGFPGTDHNSDQNVVLTVLVLPDRKSKSVTASVVPQKGYHPYTVQRIGVDIANILAHKSGVQE